VYIAIIVSYLIVVLTVMGCAASPDTWIYVDKSIHIESADDVDIKTSSEVKSDAKLDGEVEIPITITPAIP